jgi:hypothetical protein
VIIRRYWRRGILSAGALRALSRLAMVEPSSVEGGEGGSTAAGRWRGEERTGRGGEGASSLARWIAFATFFSWARRCLSSVTSFLLLWEKKRGKLKLIGLERHFFGEIIELLAIECYEKKNHHP